MTLTLQSNTAQMCWTGGGVAALCSLRLELVLPGAIILGIYSPLLCFQLAERPGSWGCTAAVL